MAAGKLIILVFGLLPVGYIGGFLGPGPLLPGLGPAFDQVVTLAVVVVLALVGGPWLLRAFRNAETSAKVSSRISGAENILRERYARGEVDRTQFLLMLEDLQTPNSRKP